MKIIRHFSSSNDFPQFVVLKNLMSSKQALNFSCDAKMNYNIDITLSATSPSINKIVGVTRKKTERKMGTKYGNDDEAFFILLLTLRIGIKSKAYAILSITNFIDSL